VKDEPVTKEKTPLPSTSPLASMTYQGSVVVGHVGDVAMPSAGGVWPASPAATL
jgi:hypothetical protein